MILPTQPLNDLDLDPSSSSTSHPLPSSHHHYLNHHNLFLSQPPSQTAKNNNNIHSLTFFSNSPISNSPPSSSISTKDKTTTPISTIQSLRFPYLLIKNSTCKKYGGTSGNREATKQSRTPSSGKKSADM
jgi:hypothetical protein